jgi:transcriptional regulator with XRE-family HTH domain
MDISGDKLKLKRKLKGLSQQELGELLGGLDKTTVSNWERENKPIPIKYLESLKNIFHCISEDLIVTSSPKSLQKKKHEDAYAGEIADLIYELNHWQTIYKEYTQPDDEIEALFKQWLNMRISRLSKTINNLYNDQAEKTYENEFTVTGYIRDVLTKIIKEYNDIESFSKSLYISSDMLMAWLDDKKNTVIKDNIWKRLLPYALTYLSGELAEFYLHSEIRHAFHDEDTWIRTSKIAYYNMPEKWVDKFIKIEAELKKEQSYDAFRHLASFRSCFKPVPLVPSDIFKGWNSMLTSITEFLKSLKGDYAYFPDAHPDDIAIKITDDSFTPVYPDGAYLLVCPYAMPVTGNRVVVKLTDGNVLFKVFVDNGNLIDLLPLGEGHGKKMSFNKHKSFALWIWPIKASIKSEK